MEDFRKQAENKKFFDFADAISKRVNDIGVKRGSTARSSDVVIERLYESVDGDAGKVTDEEIVEAFDAIDKKE